MASLIPGYNYDIFISYRQKDNKGEKWVSEFVEALKTELESTFKEEVSVYFDINPSDYLKESYDVDASLKDKLKCLVFIPILSRTYCDSNSFAWVHEFKAFAEQALKDQYGLKIKLPNGNVAGRVLPVRIHDLDEADIKECESVLGGVLRGIDFIYREAGIDKPLSPGDDEKKNLNNTKYRIQIIKVAHSIKEIILGMKNEPAQKVIEKEESKESAKANTTEQVEEVKEKQAKAGRVRFLIPVAVAAFLIIAGIIAYPKIFRKDTLERLRASGEKIAVAVMPFQNMTNDSTWNVWQSGIQNEFITSLTNSKELKVRSTEAINNLIENKGFTNYASITPSIARNISQKLDASVFILGSIKKVGGTIRLNAQLIDSKTEEIFKSFQIDGTEEKILQITDSLSTMIRDFLIISIMEKEIIHDFRPLISTGSSEAYKYYMFGNQAYYKDDLPTATEWYLKAIDIDSTFFEAARMLIYSLGNQGLSEEFRKLERWFYEKRNQMSEMERLWAEIIHARTPDEQIKYFKLLIALDDEMPVPYANLAGVYKAMHQYDKAISLCEKEIEIYDQWGVRPRWVASYTGLGQLYHLTGQYKKEMKIYRKAEKDFPDNLSLILNQVSLALTLGKTNAANKYVDKYFSISKTNGIPEADILAALALKCFQDGFPDMAMGFIHRLLLLKSPNPETLNKLAWDLLKDGQNTEKVIELAELALERNPKDYLALHWKGWALYKLGRYREAMEIMQNSQDIRVRENMYDKEFYLHLDSVKTAFAGMK